MDCDASAYQPGCALLQEQPDGTLRPVGYWLYSLNDTERSYHATERQCHGVDWAITFLRSYIEGARFTVCMDYDALRWILNLAISSGRLAWWRLRLANLEFYYRIPTRTSRRCTGCSFTTGPDRRTHANRSERDTFL